MAYIKIIDVPLQVNSVETEQKVDWVSVKVELYLKEAAGLFEGKRAFKISLFFNILMQITCICPESIIVSHAVLNQIGSRQLCNTECLSKQLSLTPVNPCKPDFAFVKMS